MVGGGPANRVRSEPLAPTLSTTPQPAMPVSVTRMAMMAT